MRLKQIYDTIALISPYVEILLRRLYWRNVDKLGKFNPNKVTNQNREPKNEHSDFEKVLNWLKLCGIREGDIVIVHSGYGELEQTGMSPDEIIDRLLEFIGPTGTLVMPVIRRFKEAEKAIKEGKRITEITWKYNVKKTMVVSGMLPYTLMQRKEAVVSHHPFNPLCAIGPMASAMMLHNLEGDAPSPHGPNSCWRFCYDHGAKVCSIGTDIEHHNTMGHIAEESFERWYWSDEDWYDYIKFEIIDEEKNIREITVRNRKLEWGKLHLAEINSTYDIKKVGAMRSDVIEGITVGFVDVQSYIGYLQSRNQKGYPYYLFPWESPKDVK